MAGARANLTLNPNITIPYKDNCMDSIAAAAKQLLIDEAGVLPLKQVSVRASYLFPNQDEPGHEDDRLSLCFVLGDNELCDALVTLLNHYFESGGAINPKPVYRDFSVMASDPHKTTMAGCVVIRHAYIPRFFNEILGAVSLYRHRNYSLVRDFYLIEPEGKRVKLKHDNKIRGPLQAIYQRLHQAYNPRKNIPASESSEKGLYYRLNALAHAYHLRNQPSRDFKNRLTDTDDRVQAIETTADNSFMLVHGDVFYELSAIFKLNPQAKIAFVNAGYPRRCGGEALLGDLGAFEEAMARVTDYIPRVLGAAELHDHDPQNIIHHLYQNLKPTGKTLRLGSRCGVYYLSDQTIPEYISKENVMAYADFIRYVLAHQPGDDQDNYLKYKTEPRFIPGVTFLDAQGITRRLNMVDVAVLQSPEKDFHYRQWKAAFSAVLNRRHFVDVLFLTPMDDKSAHAEASVQGFAEALREMAPALRSAGIRLVLPVHAMGKAYADYKRVLHEMLGMALTETKIGTVSSWRNLICQKYRELGGKKVGIENQTLEALLARVIHEDGRTRKALLALGWLAINPDSSMQLTIAAPQQVCDAFARAEAEDSRECIKERIIERYKIEQGFFYKNSAKRKSEFNIYAASLEDIILHAMLKVGNTRCALMNLGYVLYHHQNKCLVLDDENRSIPPVFVDAFHAVQQRMKDKHSEDFIKRHIIRAYQARRGSFFYKDSEKRREDFNIFSANLQGIMAHAMKKDGNLRRVLMDLEYVSDNLVLTEAYRNALGNEQIQIAARHRLKKQIIAAYQEERGLVYKDNQARRSEFDINEASLEEIIAHGIQKNGNVRRAMMRLGYLAFEGAHETLVLCRGVSGVVRAAFNAAFDEVYQPEQLVRLIA